MRPLFALGLIATLSACVSSGGGGGGAPATPAAVAGNNATCPSPDPVRDGPLVDAIRQRDAGPVEAILASNPGDTKAQAALAVITGRGSADPAEVACFAPYF